MNSVNNNSSLSFQASLKVSVPVNNTVKLNKIKEKFAQKTKNYADDVLHISENPDKDVFDTSNQIYHLKEGKPNKYEYPAHILEDLDVYMEKLSENELVEKLVKLFKCLKIEKEYSYTESKIDSAISGTTKALRQNVMTRDRYIRAGKDDYAKTYETLIDNNEKRLESLRRQQIEEEVKVADKLEKITKGDDDLDHIPSVYTIYQPVELL